MEPFDNRSTHPIFPARKPSPESLDKISRLCDEIEARVALSNIKKYGAIFSRECAPFLKSKSISPELLAKINATKTKLNQVYQELLTPHRRSSGVRSGKPPTHPGLPKGKLSSSTHSLPIDSVKSPGIPTRPISREEILVLYNRLSTIDEKGMPKEDLLKMVIDLIHIDTYFTQNPPYLAEIDITGPLQNAFDELSTHGIILTDPANPVWADYERNANAELAKL